MTNGDNNNPGTGLLFLINNYKNEALNLIKW